MTPKIISLSSGSKANCTLVSSGSTHILIDFGISCKKTGKMLSEYGISLADISAVFLSHEHSDHVAGLPTFLKNHDAPVYITEPSYLEYIRGAGFEYRNRLTVTETEFSVQTGDLFIEAMPVRHDSAACVAYRISGGVSLGICTDVGKPTDALLDFFSPCESIITEANYDEAMLFCGSYPQTLKYRISSDSGHTSNDDCARFVARLAELGTLKRVLLAHISPENNTSELALFTVSEELKRAGLHLDFLKTASRVSAVAVPTQKSESITQELA